MLPYNTSSFSNTLDATDRPAQRKAVVAPFKEEEEAKRKIQAIADRWQAIEKLAAFNRSQRMIATA